MAFAEVEGVRLFFTDDGTGEPPMIFVHGFSCDSHDWNWQIPHFVGSHRVIAPDLRGHGRSGVPDKDFDPLTFANDVAGLIDHLGCGPVVAVGHSLGGAIVSTLAVEYPDKVRAVISVDPGYLVPEEARPVVDGIIGALFSGDPVTTAQGFLGATYTPASPAHLRTWHLRRIAGVPDHVLQETLAGLFSGPAALGFRGSSESYLRRRECPVLAFYTDPSRAAFEAQLFTDSASKAVAWEGSGHWLHQERPDEFNHLVDSWLASL